VFDLAAARLYLVCDARSDAFLNAAIDGGVDVVQLRDKNAGDEQILEAAARFRAVCTQRGVPFILNDRPDLALACGADGVHVGQDDVPVAEARAVVGEERIVGLSTHSPSQVDAAAGVDYIAVGPVHATPTKPGRPAAGVELVRYAAEHVRIPWFAIGGLDAGTLGEAVAAGARRAVVVRAITEAADPRAAAAALREALEQGAGVGAA
jgi:thiamine-phosphate pyrophosphorylase